jgi:hypothetical protein
MGVDFERSVLGRVMLSLLMVVTIGSLVLWNLPKGRPRAEARTVVAPLLVPVGLDQDWSVFAPSPRAFTVGFLAKVTYEDGSTKTWEPPEIGKVIAPLRTYRWQKYDERIRADDYATYWYDAARFIAKDAGPGVTHVELLRRFQPVVIPGSGEKRKPLETFSFYTWDRP